MARYDPFSSMQHNPPPSDLDPVSHLPWQTPRTLDEHISLDMFRVTVCWTALKIPREQDIPVLAALLACLQKGCNDRPPLLSQSGRLARWWQEHYFPTYLTPIEAWRPLFYVLWKISEDIAPRLPLWLNQKPEYDLDGISKYRFYDLTWFIYLIVSFPGDYEIVPRRPDESRGMSCRLKIKSFYVVPKVSRSPPIEMGSLRSRTEEITRDYRPIPPYVLRDSDQTSDEAIRDFRAPPEYILPASPRPPYSQPIARPAPVSESLAVHPPSSSPMTHGGHPVPNDVPADFSSSPPAVEVSTPRASYSQAVSGTLQVAGSSSPRASESAQNSQPDVKGKVVLRTRSPFPSPQPTPTVQLPRLASRSTWSTVVVLGNSGGSPGPVQASPLPPFPHPGTPHLPRLVNQQHRLSRPDPQSASPSAAIAKRREKLKSSQAAQPSASAPYLQQAPPPRIGDSTQFPQLGPQPTGQNTATPQSNRQSEGAQTCSQRRAGEQGRGARRAHGGKVRRPHGGKARQNLSLE